MRTTMFNLLALVMLACTEREGETTVTAATSEPLIAERDTAADAEALRSVDRQALEAFRSGDAATFDALYADEAVLVNPRSEPLEGRVAIDSLHRAEMAQSGYQVEWSPIRVEGSESGDLGYVFGRWSARSTDGSRPEDHGYYVNVMRKIDGAWRTVVEVNGSSAPSTP